MTELSHIESPLVAGPTRSLESLFADWLYVPVDERNGRHYLLTLVEN